MRNTSLVLAAEFLLAVAYALGAPEHRHDVAWIGHSVAERQMYVRGYRDGLKEGELDGSVLARSDKTIETDEYLRTLQRELREQLGTGQTGELETSEIEKGMSDFYRDPQNASVCWRNAFRFAAMTLNGDSPTEEELKRARDDGSKTGCD